MNSIAFCKIPWSCYQEWFEIERESWFYMEARLLAPTVCIIPLASFIIFLTKYLSPILHNGNSWVILDNLIDFPSQHPSEAEVKITVGGEDLILQLQRNEWVCACTLINNHLHSVSSPAVQLYSTVVIYRLPTGGAVIYEMLFIALH